MKTPGDKSRIFRKIKKPIFNRRFPIIGPVPVGEVEGVGTVSGVPLLLWRVGWGARYRVFKKLESELEFAEFPKDSETDF